MYKCSLCLAYHGMIYTYTNEENKKILICSICMFHKKIYKKFVYTFEIYDDITK